MLSSCSSLGSQFGSRLGKFDVDRTLAQLEEFAQRAATTPAQLPIDVTQTSSHYIVRADVPGFTRDEVTIEAHEGVLTIAVKHNAKAPDEQTQPAGVETSEQPIRRERYGGSYSRRLAFNEGFVEDATVADLRDGVLTIRLAKVPTTKPHRIAVQ